MGEAATYADVRSQIGDADLLLFRPRNWWAKAIAVAGRSEYVHAAMAGWWRGRVMSLEVTAGGGRAQLLSNLVAQFPGVIDVYQPVRTTGFDRLEAVTAMIEITGYPYGWVTLARAALLHLPVIRFFVRPDTRDDVDDGYPPYCSAAVAMADTRGGIDPVPNLANGYTEPGDLARSAFYKYAFTLGGPVK
jgi:hypothetical protein